MKSFSTRRLLLLALLAPLFTLTALADAPVEDNGIYYTLVPKGRIATVTSNPNGYSGPIVIPPTITVSGTTYSVVGIEDNAFFGSSVTSVTIPESVTSIGNQAFCECLSLTVVDIPSSITITSIPPSCFWGCCNLTSITIPNSVIDIGSYAFSACPSLTSVTIPNSVTNIGECAFSYSGLISVDIPSSVTSIGNAAFSDCNSLNTVTNLSSVTYIDACTFRDCSSLASVTIPNTVSKIGSEAFSGCSSLTSITIPNSVTRIDGAAFKGCCSLTAIVLPNVSFISDRAFYGCTQLRSVTLGHEFINGMADGYINDQAFANCSNLEEFIIESPCYNSEWNETAGYYEPNYASEAAIDNVSSNAFEDSFVEYATLYVPASAIGLYQADAVWGQFGTITALGSASKYYKLSVDVNEKGKVVYSDGVNTNTITGTSQTFNVKENENIELTLTPNAGYKLGSVTVNGVPATVVSNKLTISNVNSDQTVNVRFVLDASSVDVTIGQLGAATFFCEEALDFSGTNDVKAYIASAFNPTTGQVTLTRITDVPAGTGIVLLGNEGTYSIPLGSGKTYVVNMLVGVDADKVLNKTEGANSNFILSDGENGVGFYPVKDGSTLVAGKAYLTLPTAALSSYAQSFSLRFGDATGISPTSDKGKEAGAWFTLDGRRLEAQPTAKGLYIVNGKKIIVR